MGNLILTDFCVVEEDKFIEAINKHSDDIPIKVYRELVINLINLVNGLNDYDRINMVARCGIIIQEEDLTPRS
jgi:hypothetical protein